VSATTLARLALDPLVQDQIPHLPYLASAVIVSWFCGVETGIVSVVIAAFVANYLFVQPRYEIFLHPQDRIAMTVVSLVASGLVLLVASWRRTEVALRQRGGEAGYTRSFIEHYLIPILYPAGLTPAHQRWVGAFVVAVNVVAYALAIRRARRRRDAQVRTGVASAVSTRRGNAP